MDYAWFRACVAGIGDETEVGFRPGPVQVPGSSHRGAHVVTPLDDDRRNMADLVDVFQQLPVAFKETAIDEGVAFDTDDGQGGVIFAEMGPGCRMRP